MIIHFYDKSSITINDLDGTKLKAAINQGAEWVVIRGDNYRVGNISKIENGKQKHFKTFDKLNLPNLEPPDRIADAYNKRTIKIDERQKLNEGNTE